RGLARVQQPVADAGRRGGGERLRRRLRAGQPGEAGSEGDAAGGGRGPGADPVDRQARERGRDDRESGDDADDEAREAAPVVQVDDLERHHAAPAEVVQEDPELDDAELPRQGAGRLVIVQRYPSTPYTL